jgi:DNA mismatch repair ATPase MutS
MLILLDEILKGTNSKDKEQGSRQLLLQLLKLKAIGIIATHDISLGEMSKTHGEWISNQCFEVDIMDDQLVFDYRIRSGVAQNMNASFLLKKMGITA